MLPCVASPCAFQAAPSLRLSIPAVGAVGLRPARCAIAKDCATRTLKTACSAEEGDGGRADVEELAHSPTRHGTHSGALHETD